MLKRKITKMNLKFRQILFFILCLIYVCCTQTAYSAPTVGVATEDVLDVGNQTERLPTELMAATTTIPIDNKTGQIPSKQPISKGKDKNYKPYFYKKSRDKGSSYVHASTSIDPQLPTPSSSLLSLASLHKPEAKENNIPTITAFPLLSSGYSAPNGASKYFDMTSTKANNLQTSGIDIFTTDKPDMVIATSSSTLHMTTLVKTNNDNHQQIAELIPTTTIKTTITPAYPKANEVFVTDIGLMQPKKNAKHQPAVSSTENIPDMKGNSSTLKSIVNNLSPHNFDVIVTTTMDLLNTLKQSIPTTTTIKETKIQNKFRSQRIEESHLRIQQSSTGVPLLNEKFGRFTDFETNNGKSINKQTNVHFTPTSLVKSQSLSPPLATLSLAASQSTPTVSSTTNIKKTPTLTTMDDVGHDGVKAIKKKQLSHDKHFLESVLNKNKSSGKITEKGQKEGQKDTHTKIIKDEMQLKGIAPNHRHSEPVFMKEKIFKVNKSGKNDKPGIVIVEEESKADVRHVRKLCHKTIITTPGPIFYHTPIETINIKDKSTVDPIEIRSESVLTTIQPTGHSTITVKPIPDIIGPNDMDIVFRAFVTAEPTIITEPTTTNSQQTTTAEPSFNLKPITSGETTTTSEPTTKSEPITTSEATLVGSKNIKNLLKPMKNLAKIEKNEQRESRISDIQIEIIESTQGASFEKSTIKPEFEQTISLLSPNIESELGNSKNSNKIKGKPEPAAIEIHINVSEGFGGDSEDLEFSYQQSGISQLSSTYHSRKNNNSETITLRPGNDGSNETEEILVVEIIDGNGNDTSSLASKEIFNEYQKFSIQSHSNFEGNEKKIEKIHEPILKSKESKDTDDIFLPDLKLQAMENLNSDVSSIMQAGKEQFDKDSDTIFYISNTEVKVGESIPTQNTNFAGNDDDGHKSVKQTNIESKYSPPAVYEEDVRIDFQSKNSSDKSKPERYEEDIILSPLKNNFDPLKVIENRNQNIGKMSPLDISYVGETFIEVEEAPPVITTNVPSIVTNDDRQIAGADSITPNVIIEAANLPEMSIGVPIIGELPPQIELKEIDFMPESAGSDISSRSGYDEDRLESSIQYGGDLIEDNIDMIGGSELDVDGGYPFGRNFRKANRANSNKYFPSSNQMQQMVNNLKKDELMADIVGSSEDAEAMVIKEGLIRRMNDSSNSTIGEKMANATAFSVMEDNSEITLTEMQTLLLACLITMIPLIFVVMLAYGLRYLWRKYRDDSGNGSGLIGDCSTDPIASKSQDELKSSESEYTINRSSDTLESNTSEIVRKYDYENTIGIFDGVNGVGDIGGRGHGVDGGGGGVGVGGIGGCSSNNNYNIDSIAVKGMNEIKRGEQNFNNNRYGYCGSNGSTVINSNMNTTTYYLHDETITEENNISTISSTMLNSAPNNYLAGVNGSVITMTLKNNHLIVETEERNDISRDARETKMHYNTSEKDGVFVVEVSRGADSQGMLSSPLLKTHKQNHQIEKIGNGFAPCLEEVQIHPPPNEELNNSLHQIDEAEEPDSPKSVPLATSNTGLSQSDLSSSSTDSNKRYAYGNQELYTIEKDVLNNSIYPPKAMTQTDSDSPPNDRKFENGDCQHRPLPKNKDTDGDDDNDNNNDLNKSKSEQKQNGFETKPIITAALLKQETVIEVHPIISEMKTPSLPANQIASKTVALNDNQPKNDDIQSNSVDEADVIQNGKIGEMKIDEPLRFNGIPIITEDDIQLDIENVDDGTLLNAESSPLPYVNSNSLIKNDPKEQFPYLAPAFTKSNDCPVIFNGQIINDDIENGFDSIMSLPDPPSSDEINSLNENTSIDVNQLDSLPPPPPPSNFNEYQNQNGTKLELKQNGDLEHHLTIHATITNADADDNNNDNNDDVNDDEDEDDDHHSSITSQPSTINTLSATNIGVVPVAATGSS